MIRLLKTWLILPPLWDVVVLAGLIGAIVSLFPADVFTASTPATGGDFGSHFWPLYTLVNHSWVEGVLRVWNPGNLAGEPHLVHYFPFPFFVMALFSAFFDLIVAYNLGTALPVVMLPASVYLGCRWIGLSFPGPILGAAFSVVFLFNESYSAWGGNFLSTLSGQFAHLYALNFFMIGVGIFKRDLKRTRLPWRSAIAFAAVALSHAYVALGIPIAAFLVCAMEREVNWSNRLTKLVWTGALAFGLCAFWLIPMLDNAPWMTAYADRWLNWVKPIEYVPPIYWPLLVAVPLAFPLRSILRKDASHLLDANRWLPAMALFASLVGFYGAMVFVFPKVGLVDIRAFPQVHLFFCVMGGVVIGSRLHHAGPWRIPLTAAVVSGALVWAWSQSSKMEYWAKWNYSGWSTKAEYKNFKKLTGSLAGSFSAPRVLFENGHKNNDAGTPRAFEMLPYFSGRATLQSLYHQATITAPAIYGLEGYVSNAPSCQLRKFPCQKKGIDENIDKFKLFSVGDLILWSDEMVHLADKSPHLFKVDQHGPWHHYAFHDKRGYAGTFRQPPTVIDSEDWQSSFFDWFTNYSPEKAFLVARKHLSEQMLSAIMVNRSTGFGRVFNDRRNCQPEVFVDINHIEFFTPCPGQAHYLKFSYNPALKASSGDELFPISPGFVGIIPSQKRLSITFGDQPLWHAATAITVATIAAGVFRSGPMMFVLLLTACGWRRRLGSRRNGQSAKGKQPLAGRPATDSVGSDGTGALTRSDSP